VPALRKCFDVLFVTVVDVNNASVVAVVLYHAAIFFLQVGDCRRTA
jgi:hypothetical protein